MSDKALALAATLLALVTAAVALLWHPASPERPLPKPGLPPGGDFTLQSAAGPVSLADLRGKVAVLHFGHTRHSAAATAVLGAVSEALEQLEPAERRTLGVLFVSLDPADDSPERVAQYAASFHPLILGTTAGADEVSAMVRNFGIASAMRPPDEAEPPAADILLLGKNGQVVDKLPADATPLRIALGIRRAMDID